MKPKRRSFLTVALGLAATCLPLSVLAADAPRKIRLLIIEGISNHNWQPRLAMVRDILAQDGSFEVDVSITPPDAPPGAPPSMRCAAFQTIMPRVLKWLAGRDPEPQVPTDFPGRDVVSLSQS